MIVAYLDNGHIVPAAEILAVCKELGAHAVNDFDCIPLYKGYGSGDVIAHECDKCGAPLGRVDPDDAKYVMLGICTDCWCD